MSNSWFKLSAVALAGIVLSFILLWGMQQFNKYQYYNNMNGMYMQGGMNVQGSMGMPGMNMQNSMNMPGMNMQGGMMMKDMMMKDMMMKDMMMNKMSMNGGMMGM